MREEARRWWRQAEADRDAAEACRQAGSLFMAAFACHQAVEKGLKAAYIELKRAMPPKTHNLVELGRLLQVPERVMTGLRFLNPEYAVSRYPDAANGVPAEMYDETKINLLWAAAEEVWAWLTSALEGKS